MITPIDFDKVHDHIREGSEQARADLKEYFGPFSVDGSGHSGYTGRWFEHFAQMSDPAHFNGNDVAAAATLSVQFDSVSIAELANRSAQLDALLAGCPPPDTPIWAVDTEVLADDAPLSRIYEQLKSIPGVGPVKASKLLAAKRPHLVPIRDRRVGELLGNPPKWWKPWRAVMSDEGFRTLLDDLADGLTPAGTSLLRVADVILWRDATRQEAAPT